LLVVFLLAEDDAAARDRVTSSAEGLKDHHCWNAGIVDFGWLFVLPAWPSSASCGRTFEILPHRTTASGDNSLLFSGRTSASGTPLASSQVASYTPRRFADLGKCAIPVAS
jgi:hypothetical protein